MFPALVLESVHALSVSSVSVFPRSQSLGASAPSAPPWWAPPWRSSALSAPPWRFSALSAPHWWAPALSAPPWRSSALSPLHWWTPALSAPPWRSSAPHWWALALSAPPWRSSAPSAPPWWSAVWLWWSSAPPWWFAAPSALSWWSSVPPIPPDLSWVPALPAIPWLSVSWHPALPHLSLYLHMDLALHPSPCSASAPPPSCIVLSGERLEAAPWGGGGGSVTNPVRGLPSTRHQRSLFHHIDSHTTQTVARHTGLHFPSSIALITQLSPIIHCTD